MSNNTSSVTKTGLIILLLSIYNSLIQANKTLKLDCSNLGRREVAKYIECLAQKRGLNTSFISFKCPPTTCLDPISQHCSYQACHHVTETTTLSPFPRIYNSSNINVWIKPVRASEETVQISETGFSGRSFGARPKPRKPSPRPNILKVVARIFDDSPWRPSSPFYNCTGRRYNCTGPGFFPDPNDKTIFYKCRWKPQRNKFKAICFTCNERFNKCWSNINKACVSCDDVNSPSAETLNQDTSYDCVGYKAFPCSQVGLGFREHPGDKSISVLCSNETFHPHGEWIGGCMTCSKEPIACFIEGIGQCVENCWLGALSPYNCTKYKFDDKLPCKEKGNFTMPLNKSTYFRCVEKKTGSGRFFPECQVCPKKWSFDLDKRECIAG